MKSNDKNKQIKKVKSTKQTGTGKGSIVDRNPMEHSKERAPQTNNLGKHGEGQKPQAGIMDETDDEDTQQEQKRKNKVVKETIDEAKEDKKQNKKPDAEEMNESDEELFDSEEYKK